MWVYLTLRPTLRYDYGEYDCVYGLRVMTPIVID
jgi:hypothetical protein